MNARETLYTALMTGGIHGRGHTPDRSEQASALLDAYRESLLPAWEAVYEPGNVSNYLIGYTNDEAPAKAAAEAWFRTQYLDQVGQLVWTVQRHGDRHTAWFDLTHVEPDGTETGPGITVRQRKTN